MVRDNGRQKEMLDPHFEQLEWRQLLQICVPVDFGLVSSLLGLLQLIYFVLERGDLNPQSPFYVVNLVAEADFLSLG